MSDVSVATMAVLELLADVAYHDGAPRELAVIADAWWLAGYNVGVIDVTHASRAETTAAIEAALRGRHRRLLRHDAAGVVHAVSTLAELELVTYATAADARRLRWLERGGHDGPRAPSR